MYRIIYTSTNYDKEATFWYLQLDKLYPKFLPNTLWVIPYIIICISIAFVLFFFLVPRLCLPNAGYTTIAAAIYQ